MKRVIALMMAMAMTMGLLAGCGKKAEETKFPGSQDTGETVAAGETKASGETEAAQTEEKHLNVAYHSQIKNLDPGTSSWDTTRIGVGERLFRINDDLEVEPWLAESCEQVDEVTWVLILRDDVFFTNGKKMDGEVVKACLERTIEMNQRAVTLLKIDSMDVDGQKITIKTNGANAALINNMADHVATILDVDSLAEGSVPIGTGPFVIEEWGEDKMELSANKDYWNGTPRLDTVTIKFITDGNAQAMALDNGEVDLAFQLPTENVEQFKGNDAFIVDENTGSRSQIMYFNYENEFLADINVRKAISMAIDRDTLAKVVNKGNSEAATGIWPVSFSYGKVDGIAYDMEGAQRILADAGYSDGDGDGILDKDGKSLSFSLYTYGAHGALLPTFAEAIQAELKKIGIAVDIQLNDYDPHTDILKSGQFDLAINSYIMAPVADPQYFADIMLKTGADYNYGHYSNSSVDVLVDQMDQEFDAAKRGDLAVEIQKHIVEDCGFFTIGHLKYQVVATKNVSGYSAQATEQYLLSENTDIN